MFLKNYMEVAVDHVLPNLMLAFPGICFCDKCQMDIKALSLNNLKPHYIVSEKGQLYTKVQEMGIQFEADVMKALIDAIAIVGSKPQHESDESPR